MAITAIGLIRQHQKEFSKKIASACNNNTDSEVWLLLQAAC